MTQEEKAKAYDEALAHAKLLLKTVGNATLGNLILKNEFENMFPELKEENEEEKIRKCLIDYFTDFHLQTFAGLDPKKIIAWLEKQGEKKYDDKVEPKFEIKKGKWYVCTQTFTLKGKIVVIKGQTYQSNQDGIIEGEDEWIFVDKLDGKAVNYFKPWTIQDAKDGDVLEFGDHGRLVVGIVSYVNKTTGKVDVSCLLENNNFKVGNYYNLDTVKPHPATKEQSDLLFQKMKEAGYKWDNEKKELKKIGSTWSEKDKEMCAAVLQLIADSEKENGWNCVYCNDKEVHFSDIIAWFNSLRHQSQWKPNDAQMDSITCAVRKMKESDCYDSELVSLFNDLKKLREE